MIKLLIFFCIVGFVWTVLVEPYVIKFRYFKIKNKNLYGKKVIFVSDWHIKPYEKFRLKRIVKLINNQKPDLVLSGGDFVNSHKPDLTLSIESIAKEIGKINSKYGIYTVLGNHDGWQGKYKIEKVLTDCGIKVLENTHTSPLEGLTIAGVEDLQTGNPDISCAIKDFEGTTILLTHTPDIFPQVPDNVALTLAGHTHGGQVVFGKPLIVPSKYKTKYAYGLKQENGKFMYVTRGLGSSILPVRFFCPPEIVVIEFE